MIRLICKGCGVRLNAKGEQVGKRLACPKCGAPIMVEPPVDPPVTKTESIPPAIPQRREQNESAWYYQVMGEIHGPLSSVELKAAANAGQVTQDTLVRKGLYEEWVGAWRVKGLLDVSERGERREAGRQPSALEATEEAMVASPPVPAELEWHLEREPVTLRNSQEDESTRADDTTPNQTRRQANHRWMIVVGVFMLVVVVGSLGVLIGVSAKRSGQDPDGAGPPDFDPFVKSWQQFVDDVKSRIPAALQEETDYTKRLGRSFCLLQITSTDLKRTDSLSDPVIGIVEFVFENDDVTRESIYKFHPESGSWSYIEGTFRITKRRNALTGEDDPGYKLLGVEQKVLNPYAIRPIRRIFNAEPARDN